MKNPVLKISLLSLTLAIASCSDSPQKSAVNGYLRALQESQSTSGGEWQCLKDPLDASALPSSIENWKVTGQERLTDKKDPDSQFDVVSVKITSVAPGGFSVTETWNAAVWKSDDLFEHQKRFFAEMNQLLIESNQVMNQVRGVMGQGPEPVKPESLSAPDRANITSKSYCITKLTRVE